MMLVVGNGCDGWLTYRAGIFRKGAGRLERTSVCPVGPGLAAYGHWPHPFDGIVLLAPVIDHSDRQEMTCE